MVSLNVMVELLKRLKKNSKFYTPWIDDGSGIDTIKKDGKKK